MFSIHECSSKKKYALIASQPASQPEQPIADIMRNIFMEITFALQKPSKHFIAESWH